MAGAFVYSIIAVLVIAIVSITGFPSNIHERMTRAERLAIFGSEDSVPEYKVFSMSLSRTRRSVESHKTLKLEIELDGRKIVLNFKPTAGYLASTSTPVWLARSDKYAYQNISYDPLPAAMRNIGKFKMYHDVEHRAAIIVYTDPTEETVIEGLVAPNVAIRSLPKRLMKTTLKIGDYLLKTAQRKKRSNISDTDEDTRYFALFNVPDASKNAKRIVVRRDILHREKRAKDRKGKQKVPEAFYPKILIVLHHNIIRSYTITQSLRFILAFWNRADLSFRVFDKPNVHLNIAGIIIAADEWATPYIDDKDVKMGNYFYHEKVRFPWNRYHMIIAMVPFGLHHDGSDGKPKVVENEVTADCGAEEGYLMSPSAEYNEHAFQWSNCSRNFFKTYFSFQDAYCLHNKPRWSKPGKKILPGMWLSMDGQCQNYGYEKSCKLKKISRCVALGCEDTRSKCIRKRRAPLPGSECGWNMYCNSKKKCVHERSSGQR